MRATRVQTSSVPVSSRVTPARFPLFLSPSLLWASLIGILSLSACAPKPTPPALVPADWLSYAGFVVPAPMLPLRADGSVLFEYRGERESGNLEIQVEPGPVFSLRLSAKLIGTTALDIRFDPKQLLAMNYADDTYFSGVNDRANRRRLFSVDIDPDEFLMILTGRVTREAFDSGGGAFPEPGVAAFHRGGAVYRYTLGENGLPRSWSKSLDGREAFRVEYRSYLRVETGPGASLEMPRKIRVYTADPKPRIVLGFREVAPWQPGAAPIDLKVNPGAGLTFSPLPEEAAPPAQEP